MQFYLGVADAESWDERPPYSSDFAADERATGQDVRAMARLLTDRLAAWSTGDDGLGSGRAAR